MMINKYGFPPKGKTLAILMANIFSLTWLLKNATKPHNKNKAKKPLSQASHGFWGIKIATINAAMAMLHQSK